MDRQRRTWPTSSCERAARCSRAIRCYGRDVGLYRSTRARLRLAGLRMDTWQCYRMTAGRTRHTAPQTKQTSGRGKQASREPTVMQTGGNRRWMPRHGCGGCRMHSRAAALSVPIVFRVACLHACACALRVVCLAHDFCCMWSRAGPLMRPRLHAARQPSASEWQWRCLPQLLLYRRVRPLARRRAGTPAPEGPWRGG